MTTGSADTSTLHQVDVYERAISISRRELEDNSFSLAFLKSKVERACGANEFPLRLALLQRKQEEFSAEIAICRDLCGQGEDSTPSIFEYRSRTCRGGERTNIVLIVPTGVGAAIGGHAGDAGPVAKLLGGVCDRLITHPNVVNGSDINELPSNGLYVEGSTLTKLLMGTAKLIPTARNRLVVIIGSTRDESLRALTVNTVNAARSCYGAEIVGIYSFPELRIVAEKTDSGRASGTVRGLSPLISHLAQHRDLFDAVAIASPVEVSGKIYKEYFQSRGEVVNPWGGAEALLTHAISLIHNLPTAHAPIEWSPELAETDFGVVDERMAAEVISSSYLQCVLKGLVRSPGLVTSSVDAGSVESLTAEDITAIVVPAGCLGLATLAALYQGIRVIVVRENTSLMRNTLDLLPWGRGQMIEVENYWDAAGVIAALRAGVDPYSVRRPLQQTPICV
ncbi:MAG TPA: DUF3326 domain-containing protein [Acidobacteriota bacterium]|nr:DUF3326 domain-containing protein [Acidobacteriota bacterium]